MSGYWATYCTSQNYQAILCCAKLGTSDGIKGLSFAHSPWYCCWKSKLLSLLKKQTNKQRKSNKTKKNFNNAGQIISKLNRSLFSREFCPENSLELLFVYTLHSSIKKRCQNKILGRSFCVYFTSKSWRQIWWRFLPYQEHLGILNVHLRLKHWNFLELCNPGFDPR